MPSYIVPVLCALFTTIAGLAISGSPEPTNQRRDSSEHVLCNCLNNGLSSSQVAYVSLILTPYFSHSLSLAFTTLSRSEVSYV